MASLVIALAMVLPAGAIPALSVHPADPPRAEAPSEVAVGPGTFPIEPAGARSTGVPPNGAPVGPSAAPRPSPASATDTIDLIANTVLAGSPAVRYANDLDGIAFDPTADTVFVAGSESGSIMGLGLRSGASQTIAAPLTSTDSGPNEAPGAMAYDSVDHQLFVADPGLNQVEVYNVSTSNGSATFSTNVTLAGGADPQQVLVIDSPDYIFVAEKGANAVAAIAGNTDTLVAQISVYSGPMSLAYDSTDDLVYVAGVLGATVSTFTPNPPGFPSGGAPIPVPADPSYVAWDPLVDQVWVASPGDLTAIDGATEAVLTSYPLPTGSRPGGLAWDPTAESFVADNVPAGNITLYTVDGNVLTAIDSGGTPGPLVVNQTSGDIAAVDTTGNELLEISGVNDTLTSRVSTGVSPGPFSYDPVSGRLDIPDTTSDRILEVSTTETAPGDHPVVRYLPVPGHPVAATFDSSAGLVVVALSNGEVVGLNVTTGAVVASSTPTGASALTDVLYADGQVFLSGSPSSVWSLNPVTLATEGTVNLPTGSTPRSMTFDPSLLKLYVTLGANEEVGEIDATNDQFLGSFLAPTDPEGIVYDPSNGYLFIAEGTENSVDVVSAATTESINNVAVGDFPTYLEYVAATQTVYVASTRSSEVSVLSAVNLGVSANILVGDYPDGLAYVNATGELYVADGPDSALSLISVGSPSGVPFNASFSATPSPTDVDLTTHLEVETTSPAWDFSFLYTDLPAGCRGGNYSVITCQPTSPNPAQSISVEVTSLGGDTENVTGTIDIAPDPTVPWFNASRTAVTVFTVLNLSVVAEGGTPPYRYSYSNAPAGCVGSTASNISCRPTTAGTYPITALVVDADGYPATANLTITVNRPLLANPTLSVPSVNVGSAVTISAGASDGTPPYHYTYTGLPAGCTSADASSVLCTPKATGNFSVKVSVVDASGASAVSTIYLLVNSAPSTSSAGLGVLVYAGVGIGLVVVVAIIAIVLSSRRRRAVPPLPEEGEGAAEAEATYGGAPSGSLPPAEPGADEAGASETATVPRYFVPTPGANPPSLAEAPEPEGGATAPARANLVCRNCGTVNEPWIVNCRKCHRPLQFT